MVFKDLKNKNMRVIQAIDNKLIIIVMKLKLIIPHMLKKTSKHLVLITKYSIINLILNQMQMTNLSPQVKITL